MIVQLVGVQGQYSAQRFTLAQTPFIVGREFTNTLQFRSQLVSRHHAAILLHGRDYVFIDLNSLNGVTVNGEHINDERVLQDGDLIAFGDEIFRFERSSVDTPDQASVARKTASDRADSDRSAGVSLVPTGISCPQCGRVIDLQHQHCPWDGALLANGFTPRGNHNVVE
jgi:pSer/pThr/pTyr-binding forkhead associated (FHA) protein